MQLSSFKLSSWGGCTSQGPLLRLQRQGLVTRLDSVCDLSEVTLHSAVEYLYVGRRTWSLTQCASKLKTIDSLKCFPGKLFLFQQ